MGAGGGLKAEGRGPTNKMSGRTNVKDRITPPETMVRRLRWWLQGPSWCREDQLAGDQLSPGPAEPRTSCIKDQLSPGPAGGGPAESPWVKLLQLVSTGQLAGF